MENEILDPLAILHVIFANLGRGPMEMTHGKRYYNFLQQKNVTKIRQSSDLTTSLEPKICGSLKHTRSTKQDDQETAL